jgi:hypothetical protein
LAWRRALLHWRVARIRPPPRFIRIGRSDWFYHFPPGGVFDIIGRP